MCCKQQVHLFATEPDVGRTETWGEWRSYTSGINVSTLPYRDSGLVQQSICGVNEYAEYGRIDSEPGVLLSGLGCRGSTMHSAYCLRTQRSDQLVRRMKLARPQLRR